VNKPSHFHQETNMTAYRKASNLLFNACAAAVTLTGILATGNAFAGPSSHQTVSEVVNFQDLKLNASAGVATLYSRIHAAAIRVCSSAPRDLAYLGEEKNCATEVEAKAVQQLNVDALTAYFEKTSGRPIATFAAN
jgi:UrcA family protein